MFRIFHMFGPLHNAAFCVVLVNLIFNVLLFLVLTRVVIVTIIHFKKNDNRLDGKRLAYTLNINTMLLKLTMS